MARNNPWSQGELQYLYDNYREKSVAELSREMGRTPDSVKCKLQKLKMLNNSETFSRRNWTSEEVEYLKAHYPEQDISELSSVMGRSTDSVNQKLKRLGLKEVTTPYKAWTEEEIQFIEQNYSSLGSERTAKKLGRTRGSVKRKAEQLKINMYDDGYVKLKQLARIFNSDPSVIRRWVSQYGLPCQIVRYGHKKNSNISYNFKSEDFWEWAESHKEIINWNNYEMGSLQTEPVWLNGARSDNKYPVNLRKAYTFSEIKRIKTMYLSGLPTEKIAEETGRSRHGIQYVIRNLAG